MTDTVNATDLSCQGLVYCVEHEDGTVTHHGQLVTGYAEEIERRGDDHVHECELIGHLADEVEILDVRVTGERRLDFGPDGRTLVETWHPTDGPDAA